jgi:hypothetical protein
LPGDEVEGDVLDGGEIGGCVMVGRETYFRGVDGILMPTRKDQPPPELRNFDLPPK